MQPTLRNLRRRQSFNLVKFITTCWVICACLAMWAVNSQAQLSLNFASTPGSTIQFNGTASTFQFNTSTLSGYAGSQWSIGSETGGTGSAVGLFGVVNNSPFGYGPISQ